MTGDTISKILETIDSGLERLMTDAETPAEQQADGDVQEPDDAGADHETPPEATEDATNPPDQVGQDDSTSPEPDPNAGPSEVRPDNPEPSDQ